MQKWFARLFPSRRVDIAVLPTRSKRQCQKSVRRNNLSLACGAIARYTISGKDRCTRHAADDSLQIMLQQAGLPSAIIGDDIRV